VIPLIDLKLIVLARVFYQCLYVIFS